MKIEDCITEPLKFPISICLTESDFKKWNKLRTEIRKINKHAAFSELARKALIELMNEIEKELQLIE